MRYRSLGGTGLMVSKLCLGCMTFGRELDEEGSRALISRFLDVGGNFIDTADVYERGTSEKIVGRAIKDVRREDVVLATKVRFPMGEGPNDAGLSRKHVLSGCEATVPGDYETPLRNEWTQEEVDSFKGTMKPTASFIDAEERERVRRLTSTLIHNPNARAMLSELTLRRDAFVADEGLMPEGLPLY
jgi:hypothetical protein